LNYYKPFCPVPDTRQQLRFVGCGAF